MRSEILTMCTMWKKCKHMEVLQIQDLNVSKQKGDKNLWIQKK